MTENLLAGRYKIVKSLGEGGMADVYLAIDTIINREVAIKILRGELGNDPVTLLRFQREANAASKLNHPNVVQVYDVGTSEDRHFIVMEYIRGKTLKQLIQLRGALHKEEAISIMKQLLSAVAEAHRHNIIHRDIKPQNVLVKDDGTVKITDFGIALAHNAVQLTQSDSVLGSAHYLAPETTRGEAATNQCDIYSLGIVFYELLSGSVPFTGDNPVQIAMKHLSEEIPSIREFNPSLPQSIENIIIKATAKNKAYRYQNVEEMLHDVETCLDEDHLHDEKIVFQPPKDKATTTVVIDRFDKNVIKDEEEPKKDHKWLIGSLIVFIVIAVSVMIMYFSGVFDYLTKPKTEIIPDVSNKTVEEATQMLTELGFVVNEDITYENSSDYAEDMIIRTSPAISSEQEIGTEIKLTVSKGPAFIIENYVGKNINDIQPYLEGMNIEVIVSKVNSDQPTNTILSQDLEAGTAIDPDDKKYRIRFTVAGEKEFVMMNLIGQPIEEAQKTLTDLGAVVELEVISTEGMSEEELLEIERGVVITQSQEQGTYYIQSEGKVIILSYYE
ncbi:Stk1 family PASTA domain-containing Ser/Thr kinase [uncultured Traorella sp.]|uniref:Stk1 family PASTA domain-containing Ser/Thr kinase n=1 Tax=uncultured Traorella sp. TaxID=1929048 RepID=UPI0025FFF687|nr:Stk1 family PASTA domain-containing Ser/Thr kinase [uncultured Traorella sp.]